MNTKIEKIKKEYAELFKNKKSQLVEYSEYFLKKNFHYRKNFKKDKILKNDMGKVYFVSGILHLPAKTKVWKKVLKKSFLKIDMEFFDTVFYVHSEKEKVKKIVHNLEQSLSKTFKDNNFDKRVIIFAHSFGGILAKTAISNLPKKFQERVVLVTLGTPHSMKHGMVLEIRQHLKTPNDLKYTTVFTFGGVYDVVVPAIFSHSKKSLKVDILSDHMMFLYSGKTLEKIFNEVFVD